MDYNNFRTWLNVSQHDALFVQLRGWYESDSYVHIAMEYIHRGHLRDYLEVERSEGEAKAITRQLLEGLLVIHQEGFAHRDLKPEVGSPPIVSVQTQLTRGTEYLCSLHISHMGQNWGLWTGETGEGRFGVSYRGRYQGLRCSRSSRRYQPRNIGVYECYRYLGAWVYHARNADTTPPFPGVS